MPPVIIDSKLSDTASYNAWVGTRQELYILLEWGILRQSKQKYLFFIGPNPYLGSDQWVPFYEIDYTFCRLN